VEAGTGDLFAAPLKLRSRSYVTPFDIDCALKTEKDRQPKLAAEID